MNRSPRELLATISGGRVIDVATGSGEFVSTLVDGLADWSEIVGIDTDPANAEAFADEFGNIDGIRFEEMDGLRPKYPPGSFDTASISNSLHHFPRPATVLRKMLGLLRAGGTLIVSEMYRDRQSAQQITHVSLHHWVAEIDREHGIVHRPTYTRRQLLAIVERLDLDDVRTAETTDTSSDPKDPGTIEAIDRVIDRHLARAEGQSGLLRMGEEVRRRLHADGIHGATTLLMVGRKRAA